MSDRQVLGIDVPASLLPSWRGWWAPRRQPFPVDGLSADLLAQLPAGAEVAGESVPPTGQVGDEVRDTFFVYGGAWRWLTEDELRRLPGPVRSALLAARRRQQRPKPVPRWPSAYPEVDGEVGADQTAPLDRDRDAGLLRWVAAGVRPSRHTEVDDATWRAVADVLPGARALAGTFPDRSGANCFGTVMGAAGVEGAAEAWMEQEPFEQWLMVATETVSGTSHDDAPGVVLLWHERGVLAHAAVTLGDGWALSKPSQSWSSPRLVWTVRETVSAWTSAGARLSRRLLRPAPR